MEVVSKSRAALREWIARDPDGVRSYILDRTEIYRMSGCWVWQRSKHRQGYGFMGCGGATQTLAHIAAYEAFVGPVPDGLLLRHKCDNTSCCNPAHLETGTQADNMRDMIERGRGVFVKGEKSGMAKLNNHQVIVIRELRAEGLKQREIAMVVGCSRSAVSNVLNGRAWRHVQEASS